MQLAADLCAAFVPMVYGGQLDPWTRIDGLRVQLEAWPCPGDAGVVSCSCPCHAGGTEHLVPPRRTAPSARVLT